jgi:hypothetical protein
MVLEPWRKLFTAGDATCRRKRGTQRNGEGKMEGGNGEEEAAASL